MTKRKSIDGFNILKILAALIVMFYHYQQYFNVPDRFFDFVDGPVNFHVTVEMFFMLSGFLTLHTARPDERPLPGLARKLLRYYPMAALACACALLFRSVRPAEDLGALWNLKALAGNFLLIFVGWPGFYMFGYNHVTWYLCVLTQCYLAYALLLWLRRKLGARAENGTYWLLVSCGVIVLVNVLERFQLLQRPSFRGLESFFLGTALCVVCRRVPGRRPWLALGLFAAACALMALWPAQLRRVQIFLLYPSLILLSVWTQGCLPEKAGRVFGFFAMISFEAFLWHQPLIFFEQMLTRLTGFAIPHSDFTMLLFCAAVWALAWVMYTYVEVPLNRWVRRLTARW